MLTYSCFLFVKVESEQVKTVRGSLMLPLLPPGQKITLLTGYYDCNLPKVNEIVVLNHANRDTPLIKIIKGVSGDKFSIMETDEGYMVKVNEQGRTLVEKLPRVNLGGFLTTLADF